MSLKSLEILKQKKLKKTNNNINNKNMESQLLLELRSMLKTYLHDADNDAVVFEVKPGVLATFVDVLNDDIRSLYTYKQFQNNNCIFEFRQKTIEF